MMKSVNIIRFAILFCCVFGNIFAENDLPPPSVVVNQGKMIGFTMTSSSGRVFNSFMGIPYGVVPKRFDVPQPAGQWTGDLMATENAEICCQFEPLVARDIVGTEDCLFLNVYTPRIPTPTDDELMPVMVFIYGGAFVIGSSFPLMYGPQHFMNKDVVIVVINYRVGFLGFLSTGDDAAQGNWGLWDQRLALQWVQDNIKAFGGNKNQVTIFGESAGAASVTYHMLSPQSAGLFHQAIVQSGAALCPWALDETPLKNAEFLAKQLDCPTENTKELVECLRTQDPEDISMISMLLNFKLGPVVEVGNNEKFLPDHPYKMFQEGKYNKVPVMIGVVLDEGVAFYSFIKKNFNCDKKTFIETGLKKSLGFFLDDDFVERHLSHMDLYDEIADVYFKDVTEPVTAIAEGIELVSDICHNGCTDNLVKFLAAQDIPVFYYVFEYISNMTSQKVTTFTGKPDVPHTTDLFYMFDVQVFNPKYSDEDLQFINSVVTMWTKFAELGDPTPNGKYSWRPTSTDGNQFFRIGKDMRMDENYIPERMNVCTKLNKEYLESQLA